MLFPHYSLPWFHPVAPLLPLCTTERASYLSLGLWRFFEKGYSGIFSVGHIKILKSSKFSLSLRARSMAIYCTLSIHSSKKQLCHYNIHLWPCVHLARIFLTEAGCFRAFGTFVTCATIWNYHISSSLSQFSFFFKIYFLCPRL